MPPATTRDRIVAAAVEATTSTGWASVTMGRLAAQVGVSRQTVYNEIGSKSALAEAMVLAELARFLDVVDAAFDAEPDDFLVAMERSIRDVLVYARDNRLLHAVVSATHGADTELLPLLTTNAGSLLDAARRVVAARWSAYEPDVVADDFDVAVDLVVRVVLSHVMQPSGTPEETAAGLVGLIRQALATV